MISVSLPCQGSLEALPACIECEYTSADHRRSQTRRCLLAFGDVRWRIPRHMLGLVVVAEIVGVSCECGAATRLASGDCG